MDLDIISSDVSKPLRNYSVYTGEIRSDSGGGCSTSEIAGG